MTGSEYSLFFVFGPKSSLNDVHSDTPTKKNHFNYDPYPFVKVSHYARQRLRDGSSNTEDKTTSSKLTW